MMYEVKTVTRLGMDNKLNSIMWIFSNFREDRMTVFYFRNKFESLALGVRYYVCNWGGG